MKEKWQGKKTVVTSCKYKKVVHGLGQHYTVKITAPHKRFNAFECSTLVCDVGHSFCVVCHYSEILSQYFEKVSLFSISGRNGFPYDGSSLYEKREIKFKPCNEMLIKPTQLCINSQHKLMEDACVLYVLFTIFLFDE